MNEAAFQKQVIDLARLYQWECLHVGDARKIVHRDGKPIAVPDPEVSGLPDLLLVHEDRRLIVYAELKSQTGRLRPKQAEWLRRLAAAGADVRVWRPSDWAAITTLLTGRL